MRRQHRELRASCGLLRYAAKGVVEVSRQTGVGSFRIGGVARSSDGLRIGVTRRPPRGVPRSRWRKDHYFDVWLPSLAPSLKLLKRFRLQDWDNASVRRKFFATYARELSQPQSRQMIDFLAQLSGRTRISLGCYCKDESRCHRSVLLKLLRRAVSRGEI
jgi:uncharacterized protein YeaO (DUF488 family)